VSFWVDDRGPRSKGLFSFLMFAFTLVETGGKEGVPGGHLENCSRFILPGFVNQRFIEMVMKCWSHFGSLRYLRFGSCNDML